MTSSNGPNEEVDLGDDYADILSDDEDFGMEGFSTQGAQRKATDSPADMTGAKGLRPAVNTKAQIDDQIASLSRHASKLKLDELQSGLADNKGAKGDRNDRATSEQVLDPKTRMLLLQMINRNVVSEINGCLSTGKEANVYHAITYPEDDLDAPPLQRAIKVYKTAILVFKDRDKYVTGEFRFRQGYQKSNSRAMVRLWAEKEMRNLKRLHSAGIPTPEPLALKDHVLVMDFLGNSKGFASPRLKDVVIEGQDADEQWRELYIDLLSHMRTMYQVCSLVHADLSEYNMLYHKRQIYIIDVSQSVELDHPRSLEFLRMDIKNVTDFFKKKGVFPLSEPIVYNFITKPKLEQEDARDELKHLFETREEIEDAEADEVDTAVYRQQYIPRDLTQVYDVERDIELIKKGGGEGLVYKDLLANHQAGKDEAASEDGEEVSSEEEEEGSEEEDSEEEGSGEEKKIHRKDREDTRPRGKRFEDKETKKAHKQAVKEERKEKRTKKMPKHLKKKLINQSKRR
ncbi:protein kinase rio1 [Ascosphaera atra]|nr:protein kinase rio1 [Ascosphaera atra]